MQDDVPYHDSGNFVNVGLDWTFAVDALWANIDEIEAGGIALADIGLALGHNWSATVVALALRNIATLRALIAEARP